MCGRFALTLPPEAVRRWFGYEEQPNFPPRYNIAPTQPIGIVWAERRELGPVRHFTLARWAFLPGFVKDPKIFPLVFNARCEGISDKPSFRNAIRRRRCLVPADCFYEWRRVDKTSRPEPFLFRRAGGGALALAGLWETWMGPNGEEVDTACIVTTEANGATAAIHSRLPAIIEPDDFALWLDPDERSADQALALLRPPANNVLSFTAIGDAVNKVANDGPEIQMPLAGQPAIPVRAPDGPAQGQLF
ncbi:MAG: SOS response-associated peptidase [Beijerinckiaceae bacterium]|nr:SOS response-associated peptidase [Beijerinckiaceae bacterium]